MSENQPHKFTTLAQLATLAGTAMQARIALNAAAERERKALAELQAFFELNPSLRGKVKL